MGYLKPLVSFVAALLVPVATFLSVVHQMATDRQLYLWGYETFNVSASTGMSRAQLEEATDQLLTFFEGGPPVSLKVLKGGQPAPLYNDKEMRHLDDVRNLMGWAWSVQLVSLVALIVATAGALVVGRRAGLRWLAKVALGGGLMTVASVVVLGLLALSDFQAFWTQFHILSFSNDLWLLDPRTDYLIRMFPPPFWFQVVMLAGLRSVLVGTALALAGVLVLWVTRGPAPSSQT